LYTRYHYSWTDSDFNLKSSSLPSAWHCYSSSLHWTHSRGRCLMSWLRVGWLPRPGCSFPFLKVTPSGCPPLTGGENNGGVEREKEKVMAIWDDSTSIWGIAECTERLSNRRTPRDAGLRHAGQEVCCLLFDPAGPPSLHPPILSWPPRETGPFLLQSSRRCVADVNVMAVCVCVWGGGVLGLWWVRTQQAVLGGVAPLSPPLSPRQQVACYLSPPAHLTGFGFGLGRADESPAWAQEADVRRTPRLWTGVRTASRSRHSGLLLPLGLFE